MPRTFLLRDSIEIMPGVVLNYESTHAKLLITHTIELKEIEITANGRVGLIPYHCTLYYKVHVVLYYLLVV